MDIDAEDRYRAFLIAVQPFNRIKAKIYSLRTMGAKYYANGKVEYNSLSPETENTLNKINKHIEFLEIKYLANAIKPSEGI